MKDGDSQKEAMIKYDPRMLKPKTSAKPRTALLPGVSAATQREQTALPEPNTPADQTGVPRVNGGQGQGARSAPSEGGDGPRGVQAQGRVRTQRQLGDRGRRRSGRGGNTVADNPAPQRRVVLPPETGR